MRVEWFFYVAVVKLICYDPCNERWLELQSTYTAIRPYPGKNEIQGKILPIFFDICHLCMRFILITVNFHDRFFARVMNNISYKRFCGSFLTTIAKWEHNPSKCNCSFSSQIIIGLIKYNIVL